MGGLDNMNNMTRFTRICITFFIAINVYAYDGDVDFSAPYITIDPETGTLVTVDPKTQTKTPHSSSGNTNSNGNSITVTSASPPVAETTVTTQAMPETSQLTSAEPKTTWVSLPVIIGLMVAGFAAAFIFRSKDKGQANTAIDDQNNS